MTYMNVDTIVFDDLVNSEDVAFLEDLAGEGLFVLIADGDESKQIKIERKALTLAEVLAEVGENESIVFVDVAPELPGFEKGRSYWGDSKLTKLED